MIGSASTRLRRRRNQRAATARAPAAKAPNAGVRITPLWSALGTAADGEASRADRASGGDSTRACVVNVPRDRPGECSSERCARGTRAATPSRSREPRARMCSPIDCWRIGRASKRAFVAVRAGVCTARERVSSGRGSTSELRVSAGWTDVDSETTGTGAAGGAAAAGGAVAEEGAAASTARAGCTGAGAVTGVPAGRGGRRVIGSR